MSIEFLITSLIVVVSPGTGALYTVTAGLSRGVRAGLVAAFGCTLGTIPHMLTVITGLAAVFHTSTLAFEILKYLGAAYLLYMAWNTLKDRSILQVNSDDAPQSPLKIVSAAILINLLNPKLPIFFLTFLPQFVRTDDPSPLSRMLMLSGIFMLMTFVVFAFYGAFSAFVRGHVLSRPNILMWMRRGFAAGFVALGVKLAFSKR
jgi:threonine/homoserine/homoserine lactone efflux protein